MKLQKTLTGLSALAIMATLGTNAIMASAADQSIIADTNENQGSVAMTQARPLEYKFAKTINEDGTITKYELTDEQKAEMEAERQAREAERQARDAAWEALTDAQKESVYAINDKGIDAQIEMVLQYKELGLITSDDADNQIKMLEESKASFRESGRMPHGMGMKRHAIAVVPAISQDVDITVDIIDAVETIPATDDSI